MSKKNKLIELINSWVNPNEILRLCIKENSFTYTITVNITQKKKFLDLIKKHYDNNLLSIKKNEKNKMGIVRFEIYTNGGV